MAEPSPPPGFQIVGPSAAGTTPPPGFELGEPKFNIDFDQPVAKVRSEIAKLPPASRKLALRQWADAYVAKERKGRDGDAQYVLDRARNVAQGVPVLGSWADEANAATSSLVHMATGGAYGAPYDESKAYQDALDRASTSNETHLFTIPYAGWNVTDADVAKLAGGGAAARALPMVQAMRGETIVPQAANALVNGAIYGGLHGAGEGNSIGERSVNALIGTAIGGGLGVMSAPVIRGLSNAVGYAKQKLAPTPEPLLPFSKTAVENVKKAAVDDAVIDPARGANMAAPNAFDTQAMRLGPEATLADMGPNLASEAGGIASLPGPGKKLITETLGRNVSEGRRAGAKDRIAADTDLVLGPAQDLVVAEREARRIGSERAKPFYDAFYKTEVKPTDALIDIINRVPESAGRKAFELAHAEGIDLTQVINTGRGIDYIKRALGDYVDNLKPGTNEFRIYSKLNKSLVDEVDAIIQPRTGSGNPVLDINGNPQKGDWAIAREQSGAWLQLREGLAEGQKAFSNGTHPDQMRADLQSKSAMWRSGYEIGARGQVRDIMGQSATTFGSNGDSAARAKLGSDYAREKLAIITDRTPLARSQTTQPEVSRSINQAYGSPTDYTRVQPERLTNRLDTEGVFEGTRQKVLGNSVTAERTAAQKRYMAPNQKPSDYLGTKETLYGEVKSLLGKTLNALSGNFLHERSLIVAEDAARMLMAQGVERNQIAAALIRYARQERASSEVKRALYRVGQNMMNAAEPSVIDSRSHDQQRTAQPVAVR